MCLPEDDFAVVSAAAMATHENLIAHGLVSKKHGLARAGDASSFPDGENRAGDIKPSRPNQAISRYRSHTTAMWHSQIQETGPPSSRTHKLGSNTGGRALQLEQAQERTQTSGLPSSSVCDGRDAGGFRVPAQAARPDHYPAAAANFGFRAFI